MTQLHDVNDPAALKALPPDQLADLANDIRHFLVQSVCTTGGHLGPNLGVVELTIALHRVFESPRDPILFDTGHQSYVHKILTGRQEEFDKLRQQDGLSGYPSRAESAHDVIENSHASTALSYADGVAKSFAIKGETDRTVVVVVGDGALTGGMTWEALNNLAARKDLPVVIVVNDNERSYAPTIGGLAQHLATLRTARTYERAMLWGREVLERTPVVGPPVYDALRGVKRGLKDVLAPQGLFEDLGLKYVGPVDGHDIEALEHVLRRAKAYGGPVIVHAITHKGHGFVPAETDEADRFHAVGIIDPQTGKAADSSGAATWTHAFRDEMVRLGAQRDDVVGITAAMCIPVGLDAFAQHYPERFFDVGIAEQHAVTSAVGMAYGGLHPVVAIYASFLNRAFDQVLLDAALHQAPVTFVLDRAGVTGDDGASHNGIWDLAWMAMVPGLRVAAPRDTAQLRLLLREAVEVSDGPTTVRYPKGKAGADIPAVARWGGVDVLALPENPAANDVLLLAVGAFATMALEVAQLLAARGIGVTVVDPRWVLPVPAEVVNHAADYRLVASLEDGVRAGGVGSMLATALHDAGCQVPVLTFGVDDGFPAHARREAVLAQAGLTAPQVAERLAQRLIQLAPLSSVVDPAFAAELAG